MTPDPDAQRPSPVWRGLWVALAAQVVLLAINLGRDGFWLDEMTSLSVASGTLEHAVRYFRTFPEQHPLYYILLRGWLTLGHGEAVLRAFSAASVLGSTALIYFLARECTRERIARIAVVLSASSPFLLYYGQEGRMYAQLLFLTLASTLVFSRWVRTRRAGLAALYLLLAIAAVYTHLFAVFAVMAQVAWVAASKQLRDRFLPSFGLAGVVAAVYAPWLLFILKHPAAPQAWKSWMNIAFGLPYTALRWTVGYSIVPANAGWKEQVIALARADAPILLVAAVGFGWLTILGMRALVRERNGLVLAFLLLPPVLALLASPVAILVSERYLIVSFPAFVIMLASGLDAAWSARNPALRAVPAGAVALTLVVALQRYYVDPRIGKSEWREVAAYVRAAQSPTDLVVLHDPAIEEVYRHYDNGGPPTITSSAPDLSARAGAAGRVWLVVGHASEGAAPVLAMLQPTFAIQRDTGFVRDAGIRVILLAPVATPGSRPTTP